MKTMLTIAAAAAATIDVLLHIAMLSGIYYFHYLQLLFVYFFIFKYLTIWSCYGPD